MKLDSFYAYDQPQEYFSEEENGFAELQGTIKKLRENTMRENFGIKANYQPYQYLFLDQGSFFLLMKGQE